MNSITQEMKYRQSLLTYAQKYGVSRASREYNRVVSTFFLGGIDRDNLSDISDDLMDKHMRLRYKALIMIKEDLSSYRWTHDKPQWYEEGAGKACPFQRVKKVAPPLF